MGSTSTTHNQPESARPFGDRLPAMLVFVSSFCVLVLEILAGRLLAPIIGVSLETFTGIIGTVLAGIALGNVIGGRLADRGDSGKLLGPAFVAGGALAWAAPVLSASLSPTPGAGAGSIVFVTVITFFAPAVALSTISPMAAKLRLTDLGETGSVVGSLSAAGTAGALFGTFLTGFVLVARFPTRSIIFGVGLVLVLIGVWLTGLARLRQNALAVVAVVGLGFGSAVLDGPCDAETAYACVQIVVDRDRPSGRALVLNGTRNSYIDVEDPTYLEFRYMRLFADAAETVADGPIRVLHIGGAGSTFPRYLNTVRPGTSGTILEIDGELIDVAAERLSVGHGEDNVAIVGDARLSIIGLARGTFDLIVGDAFAGLTIPWHLTTDEFVAEVERVLSPGGVVVANIIDGGDADFARAEVATYGERFEHLAVIVPPGGIRPNRGRNIILIASHEPIEGLDVDPDDGRVLQPAQLDEFIAGALVLTDDFAPVDQLRLAS